MGRHDPILGPGFPDRDGSPRQRTVRGHQPGRTDHLPSQRSCSDTITLAEDTLWLTLGTKLEHNDYTGFELQPGARLLWPPRPTSRSGFPAARAVRTPSRIDSDLSAFGYATEENSFVPGFPILATARIRGNDNPTENLGRPRGSTRPSPVARVITFRLSR